VGKKLFSFRATKFSRLTRFLSILASPSALPGFWIFMYRLSPYTYLVSAILSIGIANTAVKCSTLELLHFEPLPNTTCDIYLAPYIEQLGGYLNNPNATTECEFCVIADTNTFLSSVGIDYRDRWRNFGILWGFVVFNILMAVLLYWGFRVPKKRRQLALAETELVRAQAKQG
jgi:ATP-binding cassette subfamily G (WHITE) protein 2 (PDR)